MKPFSHVLQYFDEFFFRKRNVLDKSVEKIETYFIFSNVFFQNSCRL